MTARQKKYGCVMAVLLLAVVVGIPALWWAWKYYQLPELPDRRNYKTIEQRADRALAFANRSLREDTAATIYKSPWLLLYKPYLV